MNRQEGAKVKQSGNSQSADISHSSGVAMKLLTDQIHEFRQSEFDDFVKLLPNLSFRRYRAVTPEINRKILTHSIREGCLNATATAAYRHRGCLYGLAILTPLAWDTEFCEIPTYRLQLLVGDGCDRSSATNHLLGELIGSNPEIFKRSIVVLRIDGDDFKLRFAAEEAGFRIMDSICTYVHTKKNFTTTQPPRQRYQIRLFEEQDRSAILAIAKKCFDGYPNRFCLDPRIGPDTARQLYVTWADQCCKSNMADQLLVAERFGEVVGFLGWRLNEDLEKHGGIRLHGGGLGGCLPTQFGAYKELLWRAVCSLNGDSANFETHNFNFAAITTYQKLGFTPVENRFTLHYFD